MPLRFHILVALSLSCAISFAADLKLPTTPGHHKLMFETKVGNEVIKMPYLLYLPPEYFSTKDNFPLLMFLHGAGEGGTDLEAIFIHGPDSMLRNDQNFKKNYKFIGLSPQCVPGRRWDSPGSATAAISLLDQVSSQFRVDKDRVYATGLSMGGKGTWLVAHEAPDRFAAIAPISAVDVEPDKAARLFKNLSIWIICGAQDGGFTEGSKRMYFVLNQSKVDAQLTVYPNEGHGVWTRFYPDPKFYEWLLKHKRGANKVVPLPENAVFALPEPPPPRIMAVKPDNFKPEAGTILAEYYRGIGAGTAVADLTSSDVYQDGPSDNALLKLFEIPADQDDNYGTAIRGFVHPPATGDYTFWIASDDAGELWLSSNDDPKNKVKICGVSTWAAPRGYDQNPEQKSKPVKLEAGKKYYIEALQKEGGGGDNLSVGWQLPNGTQERPIPGNRLSPAPPRVKTPPAPPTVELTGPLPDKPGMHKLRAKIAFKNETIEMAYCLYLPLNYDKNKDPQPAFVFLHGNTHQGTDHAGLLNEGPPQYLNDNPKLRESVPLIGIFPQCLPNQRWDNKRMIQCCIGILDEVIKKFRVDKERVYLTGLSMGGYGTWFMAEEAPDRFAAVVPISAVAVRPEMAAEVLRDTNIWIICGANDGGFTDGSKRMFDVLKIAGLNVELMVYPNEGHGVWGKYYPDPRFYEWLLKHRRAAKPVVAETKTEPAKSESKKSESIVAVKDAANTLPSTPAIVAQESAGASQPPYIAISLGVAAVLFALGLYLLFSSQALVAE